MNHTKPTLKDDPRLDLALSKLRLETTHFRELARDAALSAVTSEPEFRAEKEVRVRLYLARADTFAAAANILSQAQGTSL